MKKSNVILQAAIAGAFLGMAGGAQAGVVSMAGNTGFATELFGSSATTALGIQPTAIVYTFNTPGGIVINPGGIIYSYHRVAGGLYSTAPLAGQYTLGGGISGLVAAVGALSTDSTTVRISLTNTPGTDNVVIGVGGTLTWTPIAGAINGVNTTLATAGGTVSLQASVASSSSSPNTGTALPADLDNGLSNSFAIATAAQAITGAVASSSTFTVVETQKVDLTATSPGSRFTSPGATLSNANSATVVNLGSVTFTNTTGTQAIADGTTDYTIAGRGTASTLGGTVTGSFKTGSTLQLTTDLACTAAVAGGTTTLNSTTLATFTSSGYTLPTSAAPNYLCMTVPATTGAIPLGTPTATFTFTKTTTTDAATSTTGSLYTLTNNGSIVDVRNYVPVAVTGWTQFLRIINTGTVAAAISAAVIDETTGVAGTSAVLISSLAAGAATTLNATQIEAVIGAQAEAARPRVRISGPTNGLEVQAYLFTPNGSFSNAMGKE